jgi:hypothetical protein
MGTRTTTDTVGSSDQRRFSLFRMFLGGKGQVLKVKHRTDKGQGLLDNVLSPQNRCWSPWQIMSIRLLLPRVGCSYGILDAQLPSLSGEDRYSVFES